MAQRANPLESPARLALAWGRRLRLRSTAVRRLSPAGAARAQPTGPAQVRWQRTVGAFFDIDEGFCAEDVCAAWGAITDFSTATAPEEDDAINLNSPQLKQILARL
jgi:hypothetical protein